MNIIESGLKFKSNLSYGNKPDEIVLHHAEASRCTIEDIHSWHLANGWAGCGYNFLVRKDGTVYRGRPEEAIGSHCPGANTHSIGICSEGDYMNETMPEAQKQAIIELGHYITNKYSIKRTVGHKEVPYVTSCPGGKFPLEEIRNAIMNGKSNNSTQTPIQTPVQTPVTTPTQTTVQAVIKVIQSLLNAQGYSDENGNKLIADGILGPHTIAAASKCLIRKGAAGDIVKWVQNRLINKGCSVGNYGADGMFGSGTFNAVVSFQAKHKLDADGIIGANTWKALLS